MFSSRPTPVKMTQEAAQKLPRYALILLLAVFIACGAWIDGLWTVRDAESFGVAWAMAQGGAFDWLLPSAAGGFVTESGPLAGWVSLVFLRVFGPAAGDLLAYRAASVFWFCLSTVTLWYGTWHLARRSEAQPVAFAFGGEASPRDYGRVVADSAVLLFVSVFGIVTRQHQPLPDTALLAVSCLNFYGLTRSLARPRAGAVISGLSAGLAVLASTLFAGVWLLAATLIVQLSVRAIPGSRDLRMILAALSAFVPVLLWAGLAFLAEPEASRTWFSLWISDQAMDFGLVSGETLLWVLKNALWYLCPVWPLALWGLYSWRRQLEASHLLMPLILMATGLVAVLFSSSQSADLVFLDFIPATAVFASFGLLTVRRSKENLLDWFSLSVFSLGLAALWAYWFAWATNFAPKMARSVQMLAPGVSPAFGWSTLWAVLAGLTWFAFVGWRLTHRPVVAWRGPWLSALGMTAAAVTLLGLYHHAIDHNRSYQTVAAEVSGALLDLGAGPGDCVDGRRLEPGVRSALSYYGGFAFDAESGERCRFHMVRTRGRSLPEAFDAGPFSRPRTDETFVLMRRTALSH